MVTKSPILIGTSGYDYPEWKGVFYPPELKRADFLAWYASSPSQAQPAPNPSARYEYDYSPAELQNFVPVIRAALSEGRKVQVYFNNHPKGHGAKNAQKLKELLNI